MADPTPTPAAPPTAPPTPTMVFDITPTDRLDAAYAMREQALNFEATLRAAVPPQPVGQGGAPQAASVVAPQPSAIGEGLKSFGTTAVEGLHNTLTGLAKALTPDLTGSRTAQQELDYRMGSIRQAVVEGVIQTALSPFVGAGTAAGQGLENLSPEVANHVVFEGPTAYTFHHLLAGAPADNTVTPEQKAAWSQPVTVRELVETATQLGAPFLVKPALAGVKKAAPVLGQAMASERGSIGPPPEGAAFRGTAGQPAAPPVPETPPVPAVEMRLNLERLHATDAVKAVMADLNRFAGERQAKARETQTHAQVIKESQGRGALTLERALKLDTESILLDEPHALALRDLFNASADYYDTVRRKQQAGNATPGELKAAFAVAVRLAELDEANGRNFARGLEMRKELSASERAARRATPDKMLAVFDKLGDLLNVDENVLADRSANLNAEQTRSWMRQVASAAAAGKDILHAAWVQALLTNPVTHSVNLVGTGFAFLFEAPERYTAEWVNALFRRDAEGVQRGEMAIGLRSIVQAIQDGVRLTGESWTSGKAPFEPGSKADAVRIRAEAYGFDPDSVLGKFLDVVGSGLDHSPITRALISEDAFMKGIGYRMEISALALREGLAENLSGAALERRVAELEKIPTPAMVVEAQDHAVLITMNKALGPAGRAMMHTMNAIPGGRVIMPFMRWGANAAKWAFQRTPGLAMLSQQNWSDIEAGGALRDKAIARMAIGQAVGAAIAWQVTQGGITGGGGMTKGLTPFRECPPYSLKINDTCYPYQRSGGQFGNMIGGVADYIELSRDIPTTQGAYDEWAAYAEAVGLALGQTFVNQTAMQGLANLFKAMSDPERQGGKFMLGLARSIVPAGVRGATRVSDEQIVREVRTVSEAIKSGLPWLASGVNPIRNQITGEPLRYPAGIGPDIVSPFFFSARKDSKVLAELVANKIVLHPVPWYIGGSAPNEGVQMQPERPTVGVLLTASERDFWITQMTSLKHNGKTLSEALDALMREGSSYWNQATGPGGGRDLMVRSIYNTYKDLGEQALRNPQTGSPNLERDIRTQQGLDIARRLPITHPRSPQYGLSQSLGR